MSNNSDQGSKRPYATLDLKATEIKVSTIGDKAVARTAAAATPQAPLPEISVRDVPLPLPAKAYATRAEAAPAGPTPAAAAAVAGLANTNATGAADLKAGTKAAAQPTAASAAPSAPPAGAARETVIVKQRGGFFSHMAASILGGAVALGAWAYGLPELQKRGMVPPALGLTGTSGAVAEGSAPIAELAAKLQASDSRLAALEKSSAVIGEVRESQSRLVAETKAALAAAASDAGAPDQIERLGAIESKLKAMADAGANDPSAGRMEQLAALTGKVSDLETSLATQLTALRKSVAGDVEARLVAATEAAETAKSGTQRIDRELAGLKGGAAKTEEALAAFKSQDEQTATQIQQTVAEIAALRKAIEQTTAAAAKPADVATAVAPVSQKVAALEQNLQAVVKAEEERRFNAERVVLALELQNLKRALDRGEKFDNELAEVEKVAGGKFDLAPLAKFKDQGVPTLADLTRDFRPSVNAMIDAETEPAGGSVVDRLIAGAKSVVRVRKTDVAEDDKSAEAVSVRMEKALKDGRLGEVLTEADTLSEKAKGAAQPFLERVAARASVDKALASLEGQLKSSLSGAPGEPQSKTE